MKTNFTQRKFYIFYFVLVVSIFLSRKSFAQPDYTFKNPTLVSGTSLQTGAVYRFNTVKTGTDALVTVKSMNGGITLDKIDESWTGFNEAFQPFIKVNPSSDGYVEFEIKFVDAGLSSSQNQAEVPMTCIDIDGVDYGNGKLYEKDQIQLSNGYYDNNTTSLKLAVTNPGGWVTGKNTSAVSIGGIDTSDKDVMYTVVNTGVNAVTIRIGAQNTSPSGTEVRYRSVYFKKFTYPSSGTLPVIMSYFNAFAENNSKVVLNWVTEMELNNEYYTIERSQDNKNFAAIGMVMGSLNSAVRKTYEYKDGLKGTDITKTIYYRIKQSDINGKSTYSPVRTVKLAQKQNMIQVNPNPFVDNIVVKYMSDNSAIMNVKIINAKGLTVVNSNNSVNRGFNNIPVNNLSHLAKGMYIIQVIVNGELTESTKLLKN
jgi:Secretion system C-terminal sorting domain